jgi:hypothetical protein
MAIHVRPVNRTRHILLRRLRKMLLFAAIAALGTLLTGTLTLYLNYILIESDKQTTFTYVYAEGNEPPPPPPPQPRRELAGGSSSASSSIRPDVIVSTSTDSFSSLAPIEANLGEGLASAGLGDLGLGMGFGGDGLGEGFGTGHGKGSGSDDGRGKRAGYNDDIQVVLALDASGSMSYLFNAVAASMEQVLNTLGNARLNGKKTKVNVGIVVYGQDKANGAPFMLSNFTTSITKLRNKVKEVPCTGYNEECGNAIQFAVRKFPWNMRERDDMLKVIFICGNEPFDQGPVNYKQAIDNATAANIIINTVHCGEQDAQWAEAAELGNGMGLTFAMSEEEAQKQSSDEDMRQALLALHKLPLLPVGAPAVQQEHLKRHSNTPPPPKGKKQLAAWLGNHRDRVINGFPWDAAEICRRAGASHFTLAHIGGRGNLPLSLRGMSDAEALATIRAAAEQREQLLQHYKSTVGGSDFAAQILETLREQALEKGINIEL